ncbi:hypothetical protein COO91_01541 [Nostoc flagelliforme CCNUN1]|uniref:Uncharacterized protein n=1 Tax=Nostoc flagelliforme CCNUN1 TaxID=2038116 RepID=A0A2K8SJP3_9NOSO|nr:hypothetical protein COO91_01541 [Nostoc flagelliforme CCNUN1]
MTLKQLIISYICPFTEIVIILESQLKGDTDYQVIKGLPKSG